jgi:hypothetical protein
MTQLKVQYQVISLGVARNVVRVYQVAPFGVPSGIPENIITAAGQVVVGLNAADADVLDAPVSSGLYLKSNTSLPRKMEWAAVAAGGGSGTMANKSGGSVAAGDVLIMDTGNDQAFKTSSIQGDGRTFAIAGETIADTASGIVYFSGSVITVNVTGNVTRGNWLVQSTTSKRAMDSGSKTRPLRGGVGVALTSYGGGGSGTVVCYTDFLPTAAAPAAGKYEDWNTATTGLSWNSAPTSIDSNTTIPDHVWIKVTDATEHLGTMAWSPAGAFDAKLHGMMVSVEHGTAAIGYQCGLLISDNTDANRTLLIVEQQPSTMVASVKAYTHAAGSYTQRGSTWAYPTNTPVSVRIGRDGSNNVSFYVSARPTGPWQLIVTQSFTFTPTKIGIRIQAASGTNTFYGVADLLETDV